MTQYGGTVPPRAVGEVVSAGKAGASRELPNPRDLGNVAAQVEGLLAGAASEVQLRADVLQIAHDAGWSVEGTQQLVDSATSRYRSKAQVPERRGG